MTAPAIVETRALHLHGLVVINKDDTVWMTFEAPWWDVRAWLWYALTRGRRARLYVRMHAGRGPALVRAVQLAPDMLRLA